MPKRHGRRRRNRRKQNSSRKAQMSIPRPPTITGTELRHNIALRFTSVAAANSTTITYRNLLDLMLVATSAVSGVDLFQFVRIRAVKVWAIAALGTPTTVLVKYASAVVGQVGDNTVHSDVSMGVEPAFVNAKPAPRSLASNFQPGTTGEAFVLTCPSGSVVDVLLSYRSQFENPNLTAQNALVAANIGQQYLRGLDGAATGGSNFPPDNKNAQI